MKHYLKILEWLEPHAKRAHPLPADWAQALFDDLTENGRAITVVPLAPNASGPRIGLCGEKFFCEAGIDNARDDALFVSRVDSAERLPETVPDRHAGEFALLGGGRPGTEVLDPVRSLFGDVPVSEPTGTPPTRRVKPSTHLRRALADAPAEIFGAWRPSAPLTATAEGGGDSLDAVLAPWSRLGLSRFARLSPRTSMILNRQIHPGSLSDADFRVLLEVFDIELLNRIVAADPWPESRTRSTQHVHGSGPRIYSLLDEIAGLPLSTHLRATVWCGMLAGRSAVEVRRALHDERDALECLAGLAGESEQWAEALLEALQAAGEAEADQVLLERVQVARDATAPLRTLAEWAAQLEFQSRQAPPILEDVDEEAVESGSPVDHTGVLEAEVVPALDAWILRLSVPDPEFIANLGSVIGSRLEATKEVVGESSSAAGLVRLVSDLDELSNQLKGWLHRLPDPTRLSDLREEALGAYGEASELLGEDVSELLERAPSPKELHDIVAILGRSDVLEHLPAWLRPPRAESSTTAAEWAVWLCDAEKRSWVHGLLEVVDELVPQDLSVLAVTPPPDQHSEIKVHLRVSLRRLIEIGEALQTLAPEHSEWVGAAVHGGEDRAAILVAAQAIEELRPALGQETFESIIASVADAPNSADRDQCIRSYGAAARFIEESFGTAKDATPAQLDAWIARQQSNPEVGGASVPTRTELSIDHDLVGADAAKAVVSYQPVAGRPYGRVLVPLVIQSNRQMDYSLRLEVDVRAKGRMHWPSDWEGLSPTVLEISRDKWRPVASERYAWTLTLEIPMREPSTATESLELEVTIWDRTSEAQLSTVRKLKWDAVERNSKLITLTWPDGVMPSYVDSHPVGPQKKIPKIVSRIESGSSFAVVAPRRFGKSTLIEYLANRLRELDYVVPSPIVCTEYFDSGGFDHAKLWGDVSDSLTDLLGVGLRSGVEDGVPRVDAFDFVRRNASDAEKRGVVILLDESQLFFARSSGDAMGNRLKDRLERHWSVVGSDQPVPVLFGFVGLPSLLERAGANLLGLLLPIEATEMDEADLNRLVLSVTGERLATTREARFKLIDIARNLFLLRTLLEALADRLNEDGRRWATHEDVAAVEFELSRELRTGGAQNVGQWLRDALNEAESINQWRPSREYPVALALAEARRRGAHRTTEVLQQTCGILNDWCAEMNDSSAAYLSFSPTRVDEHLGALRERGVIGELDLRSSLLEAWLLGQVRNGYPRSAQDALIKSAHVTIRMPEGAEPVGEGGEAKVYRFTEGGVAKTMRRVELKDDHEKQRFLENSFSLTVLSQGEHRGAAGSQFIFDLEAVGFSAESEMTAVQIYRWIEGSDLGDKVGKLDAPLVADIGYQLALAITLLHSCHIIHRDIRPKNVILSQHEKHPVLIDFGMSRLDSSRMDTRLPSEFSAPEVQSAEPQWTRSADIFGLGETLRNGTCQ